MEVKCRVERASVLYYTTMGIRRICISVYAQRSEGGVFGLLECQNRMFIDMRDL
jgi:hypothetical protein